MMGGIRDTREGVAEADSDSFSQRLRTFDERWEGQKDKEELASAGFSYTGIGDKVECGQCGLKLLNWTSTDDPLHEHATRRPLCPFINSRYRQLGQSKPPKHPQYQQLQARLDSFVAWPGRYVPKTPEELAAAGFFYIGSADRVTCFQCGITLRDWEEEHDPVTEHQRYSENCQFINKTDINQLGVTTRSVDENNTNSSVEHWTSDEQSETADARGGGNTTVSPHVFEKSSMVTCQTTDVHTSVSPSLSLASSVQTKTPVPHQHNQQYPEKECKTVLKNAKVIPDPATSCTKANGITHSVSAKLAEENRRLKDRRTCRVCRLETVSILFLPCGHLVTCSDCAPKVSDCVVCGKTILGTVRTYFT